MTITENRARTVGHIIAGRDVETGDEAIDRRAPGTDAVVSHVLAGGAAEVEQAVRAARTAFDEGPWPRMTVAERALLLNRVADLIDRDAAELATLDAEESGKPITTAEGDIAGAAALWRYAAALALTMEGTSFTGNGPDYTGLVIREPIGVAGLIVPWNFPALILSQKLPFAIGAGCTTVVKPSEFTSSSAHRLVQLIHEAGIPDGVVNLVVGDGRAGQALTESAGVDIISFTGSTLTGRRVVTASAGTMKKLSLELGGKAANIVFEDADLDDAIAGVVHGVIFNNGECCVSQPRLLVHDAVADEVTRGVVERMKRVRVGQPLDRDTQLGALIHAQHKEKVSSYVERAAESGAEVLTGGGVLTDPALGAGQFVQPAVIDRVAADSPVFQDEIFGPVLGITRFSTVDEAIALANGVAYGLANTIWSKGVDNALTAAKALRSGTVYVNTTIDAPPQMPFGGYKASGVGREMGQAGFDEFTELKAVSIRTGRRHETFPAI